MSDNSYLPTAELKLKQWLDDFYTVATAHKVQLTLTETELSTFHELSGEYSDAIGTAKTAKQAAKSAVAAKNSARTAVTADTRTLVNKIQGVPGLPDELKVSLGINPHDTKPTRSAPTVPTNLVATGEPSGTNELKWNRNGNPPATQFLVEALIGNATTWVLVGASLKVKFTHSGNHARSADFLPHSRRTQRQNKRSLQYRVALRAAAASRPASRRLIRHSKSSLCLLERELRRRRSSCRLCIPPNN